MAPCGIMVTEQSSDGPVGNQQPFPTGPRSLSRRVSPQRENLTFNSEPLQESAEFSARLIVEELLHLKVSNHGRLFRALLRSHLVEERGGGPGS